MTQEQTAPKLKSVTKTVINVNYSDLNKFITEVYGKDFEFAVDVESSNDVSHSYTVKKEELTEWNRKHIDNFIATGRYGYITRSLLIDMANKGLIEEGDYIVDVSW